MTPVEAKRWILDFKETFKKVIFITVKREVMISFEVWFLETV